MMTHLLGYILMLPRKKRHFGNAKQNPLTETKICWQILLHFRSLKFHVLTPVRLGIPVAGTQKHTSINTINTTVPVLKTRYLLLLSTNQ